MELEDFITTSLVSIKKGIRNANIKVAEGEGKILGSDISAQYEIDRDGKGIKFDIAVTVSNEGGKRGEGKIRVAVVSFGGSKTSASKEEHVSRISFEVQAFRKVN